MLTFLLFISTIHGCSSIRQGVARRGGSFSKLECRHNILVTGSGSSPGTLNLPAFNEVLEIVAPFDIVLRFVFQFGNRLSDNVR